MKNAKHLLLLMFLGSMVVLSGFAQGNETPSDDDSKYKNYRQKDRDQLDQYLDGSYPFPPKPKNNWSVGLKGGLATIAGDVRARPGFGVGLDIRKALGHVFSLRLQGTVGQTNGLNYLPARGYRSGGADNPWFANYGTDGDPENVFYNYRMNYGDVVLQGVFNLNNVNFYKDKAKWNLFLAGGFGFQGYSTKNDALNAGGEIYDFSTIDLSPLDGNNGLFNINGKSDVIDQLTNLLDGEFESPAEGHADENSLTINGDNYTVNPVLTASAGVRYKVSRRVELELEHRIAMSNDDLLDGQRWQEGGGRTTSLTRGFDSYNHTTLGIHFRLGKGEESLWWTNPLTEVYSKTQEANTLAKKLSTDSDKDGIPDSFDQEPDTPEGVPVDGQGRTLDSDNDGINDNEDSEPFTPKGCDVDGEGRALDSDNDGVPDCYDKEPNSPAGMYYDAKGVAIQFPKQDVDLPCLLPIIYFDLDKDNIKPEFYPELYYIAQVMENDPSLRVTAVGHTDNRNTDTYNEDLSQRRVNNAVDFIANTYGIDRSRFDLSFDGEKNPEIEGLPDNYGSRKTEVLHVVNRRVVFTCIK